MPTFGSLFSGIGGMDLGLERAGWECKWQVEIDDYCRRVLERHWPDVPRYGDVRDVTALPYVDLIAGGFPCQDISVAGKGVGIEGSRSGLWSEFNRLIRVVRPRVVLVENVPALLGRGLGRVLGDLAESGYDAEWDCVPAAAVGAPHIRDRIWILAYPRCECGCIRDDGDDGHHFILPKGNGGRFATEWGEDRQLVALVPGVHPRTPADWWRSQSRMDRSADGVPARVDRLKGLGNAVVPQVAGWIGRRILKAME